MYFIISFNLILLTKTITLRVPKVLSKGEARWTFRAVVNPTLSKELLYIVEDSALLFLVSPVAPGT